MDVDFQRLLIDHTIKTRDTMKPGTEVYRTMENQYLRLKKELEDYLNANPPTKKVISPKKVVRRKKKKKK